MIGQSHFLHRLMLFCWLGLIVLCLAWELWLAPLRSGSLLAMKALPLLLPLRGLWQRRLYTMQWASLLLLLYQAEGLVRFMSDHGLARGLAGVEFVLASLAFVALLMYLRPYKKASKAQASIDKTAEK